MKNFVFFCLLFSLFSCKKDVFTSTDALRYRGTLTQISQTFRDGILIRSNEIANEDFQLVLANGQFRRYLEGKNGCDGNYQTTADEFAAQTEDCDCMCNCDPNIDCAGDPILGAFEIEEQNAERLILHSLFENTFQETLYRVEKRIVLERL